MADQAVTQSDLVGRAHEMHEMYASGATLDAVGHKYGVTKERVRQIFAAAGLPKISLAERRRRVYEHRSDEVVERFRELQDERAVAEALCVPMSAVREILRKRLPPGALRRPTKHTNRYSDDELIEMLQDASRAVGGVLAKADFEAYGSGLVTADGRPWPTGQTPMKRFGSWNKALEAAGLRANPSSPIAGQILFDEAQCIDALRHVARELGESPTAAAYDEYAKKTNGALPSQATVRNRCGRWYDALAKAGL